LAGKPHIDIKTEDVGAESWRQES